MSRRHRPDRADAHRAQDDAELAPVPGRRTGVEPPGGIPPVRQDADPIEDRPGGRDALGAKENTLLEWDDEMVEVAAALRDEFAPLGLELTPQILLATAMQESAARNPLHARSFDNGLGLMQITPTRGRLDPEVADAIDWDSRRSMAQNIRRSNWRDAKANLMAGGYTMLNKARAIQSALPRVWADMDDAARWRAVLFAYNAGEGNAIAALRRGGPDGPMISRFRHRGRMVSHDYTEEIADKIDYVERHDPFDDEAAADTPGGAAGERHDPDRDPRV